MSDDSTCCACSDAFDAENCFCSCHVLDEPDHDDSVHCCPDCERPNQFGEFCSACQHERDLESEAEGQRWADEHESAPCMWWGGR